MKVKKVKLQSLKRQCELTEMMIDDKVAYYFSRLVTLTNQMKRSQEEMSEAAVMEKVLCTLTSQFDHIVVTIEETNDPTEIKTGDL